MNDDAPSEGSKAASNAQPFVAPVPGLAPFTPTPDPSRRLNYYYYTDRWLLLPLAFWTIGVLQHSAVGMALSLGVWILTYPSFGAWSLWRLKDADPKADLWPAIALLMLGVLPFLGFLPVVIAGSMRAFDALVLVTYVAGMVALVCLRIGWPKTWAPTLVAIAAATAFALSGLGLVLAIGIASAASRSQPVIYDYVVGIGGLVFALLIGLLGFGLLRAARRLARPV